MKLTKTDQDTLDGILDDMWSMLLRGVTDSSDPFHWPVLGTTGKDGCRLRTVILSKAIQPDHLRVCHTDARAAKAQEIMNFGRVSWLFYHPAKKIQLRIAGSATLHTDDRFADKLWSETKATSRLNYCTVDAPGTPVAKPSSGLPHFLLKKVPSLFETEIGRENFMAIACCIDEVDWLRLSLLGNRRARFRWDAKRLSATWLVP
ncbi:MAG: pyridoxamine 5'-phosphate oxidase family protein [Deltaproteobacteria bacterium]